MNKYLIGLSKRLLVTIWFCVVLVLVLVLSVPWAIVGGSIFFLRWLFLGKTKGSTFFVDGGVDIPITSLGILKNRLGLDESFDQTLWEEIKELYNS